MVRCGAALALVASALFLASTARADAEPRATDPSLEDMMTLVDLGTPLGGLSVSPDGSHVAVFERRVDLERGDARHTLLVLPTSGGAPVIAGDGGWMAYPQTAARQSGMDYQRFPLWSPDGHQIAYEAEREGRLELWLSSPDGRTQQQLPIGEGDVIAFAWASPTRIVFETGPSPEMLAAQRLDEAQGFLVTENFDAGYSLQPRPAANSAPRMLDLSTGAQRLATETQSALLARNNRLEPAAANRFDARAYVRDIDLESDAATPARGVYYAEENGGELRCEHVECAGLLQQAGLLGSGEIWFTRREGFAGRIDALYIWNRTQNIVRRLRATDEPLITCAGAQDAIICLHETPTQPRRLVSIDAATGALSVLYDPNRSWNGADLPRIDLLEFRDGAGLESFARLVYPAHYSPRRTYPMVIVQYRSHGFLRGGVGGEYPIFPLAARGYFVLSVDRPEAPDWETSMSEAELDRRLELEGEEERMKLDALEALITAAIQRAPIDQSRIAITGMSDGAETLYWALRRRRFAAAVASSPPVDPMNWPLMSAHFRAEVGSLIAGPWPNASPDALAWWRRNAAIYFAEEIETPLLLNVSQSEALYALPLAVRLGERGVPVETYIYPGAYHVKTRPAQLLAAQQRALAWIDFWLRDTLGSDVNGPDRAERWGALR
jgi:dipeptidyl aminopeptidase/acylaminoacyl peptidase